MYYHAVNPKCNSRHGLRPPLLREVFVALAYVPALREFVLAAPQLIVWNGVWLGALVLN